jgi:predicted nucleic acid-binding protein
MDVTAVGYVVLDTDVASLTFRRRLPVDFARRLAGQVPCVTFVTVGEMTMWAERRRWGPPKRRGLDDWLGAVVKLRYDEDVARTWGRIAAAASLRGRMRPANDTWIASCCLVEGLPLATLNTKDFVDFVEHEGLRLVR